MTEHKPRKTRIVNGVFYVLAFSYRFESEYFSKNPVLESKPKVISKD